MAFTPLENLEDDRTDGNGIIRLWFNSNVESGEWSTSGTFGEDSYKYFYMPTGFIFQNGQFFWEFNMMYQNIQIYLVNFWGLYSLPARIPQPLMTDPDTKLPYLLVPLDGRPNQVQEKRYFILVTGDV